MTPPLTSVGDCGAPIARREDEEIRALFVCAANVCRSPMAEAIFDALIQDKGVQ